MKSLFIQPAVARTAAAFFTLVLSAVTGFAEVPTSGDLRPIFNGTDLAGWKVVGAPYWQVAYGVIVGQSDAKMQGSMLFTEKSYGDVIVEGEVRFTAEIDSGIMVRKPELQIQIGVSRSLKRDMTCSFYNGKYPEEGRAPKAAELLKAGEWNSIRVEAKGDTFMAWRNDDAARGCTYARRVGRCVRLGAGHGSGGLACRLARAEEQVSPRDRACLRRPAGGVSRGRCCLCGPIGHRPALECPHPVSA